MKGTEAILSFGVAVYAVPDEDFVHVSMPRLRKHNGLNHPISLFSVATKNKRPCQVKSLLMLSHLAVVYWMFGFYLCDDEKCC